MLKETLQFIEDGIAGLNVGIPHGHKKMSLVIPNIQQGTYYLVGAETSVGKTAFADEFFVINPIEYLLENECDIKLKIIYFSFEIEKRLKMSKYIAYHLYKKYNILTDINTILSRGKNRISTELYNCVLESVKHMEKYEDFITIYDKNINPTGMWKYMIDYSNENGTWEKTETSSMYVPHNKKLFTIFMADHLNLMSLERGFNRKQNIDKASEFAVTLRNKCNYIPVFIQQLNRSISSTDRFRIDRVEPQLSDFKDTAVTQEDANVVLTLFSPFRYEMENYHGYDILKLRNKFRAIQILKNRDGEADKQYGFHFIGQIGKFTELPIAKEMTAIDYLNL